MTRDLEMYNAHVGGLSIADVATKFGRTERDTSWRVQRLVEARQVVDQINALRTAGKRNRDILDELDLTRSALHGHVRRALERGWPVVDPVDVVPSSYEPPPVEDLARVLSSAPDALERARTILQLRAQGLSSTQIAARTSLTPGSVRRTVMRLRRAGVDVPASGYLRAS